MEIVADLHLHSKYSRAVSPEMIIPNMVKWAKIKGINLMGTGDFTHPLWLKELKEYLNEDKGILNFQKGDESSVKFLLTGEISSIYSQAGKTRKIHNIVIAPSFLVVEKLNQELKNRGCNLMSDGRPIISLSARDLLDLVLSIDKNCLLIPAHIWTSWFSLFGSKSGYDSIEECFGNLSKYIYAIETGLSSTPAMNWQIKDLDSRRILSFSDAHSPANLGREATVLEIEKLGYKEIKEAITGIGGKIANTVEFYPEEGKYYYTGHRNCGIKQTPEETEKLGTTCPVCGKPLTVGVMHRVMQLSSHKEQSTENSLRARSEASKVHRDNFGVRWIEKESRPPYVSLVPLREIIAEVKGVGKLAKGVEEEYQKLITVLGSELSILLKVKTEEISKAGGEKLAEGIAKVRQGDICINPGFDGEYGMVKIWSDKKDAIAKEKNEQTSLFVN